MKKTKIILLLIIALAFLLRIVGIGSHPAGFTQDEAGLGYEAYSILKTGKDSWGLPFPLTLRSFGDFKLPLYSYLAIPSVAAFGLSEFSVRLPSAIFGTLAIAVTYFMVIELGKRKEDVQSNLSRAALITSFLLAISPWHVSLSRGAFEANLATFFIPFTIWAYLKGLKDSKYMILAALSFGLTLFSYHSARFVIPPVMFSLIYYTRDSFIRQFKVNRSSYLLPGLIIAIFGILALSTLFFGAGKRGGDVTIFNPTDKWAGVSDRRYEAVLLGLPATVARIFSNRATYVLSQISRNYVSYLSPNFLFINGAGEWSYGMIQDRGVLYFAELPFLILTLILIIKGERPFLLKFAGTWLLLSIIPVSVSKNVGFAANRVALMMPSIQIFSAYGILRLGEILRFKKKRVSQTNYYLGIFVVFFLSLIFFIEDYFYNAPYAQAEAMQQEMRETMKTVSTIESDYQSIVLSRALSVPNIWVEFYLKVDPREVQLASKDWLRYESEGHAYLDQLPEYRLGKYVFSGIDPVKLKYGEKTLVVGRPNEFPYNVKPTKTIYFLSIKPKEAVYVVDSKTGL